MTASKDFDRSLARWQQRAALLAVGGIALCAAAAWIDVDQFLQSYLIAYLFWWMITLGCLAILMLYRLVGGRWGLAIKPFLDCGAATMPLVAVLFLPIALGAERLYPWAPGHEEATGNAESAGAVETPPTGERHSEAESSRQQRELYLNPPFFYIRAAGYFVVWLVLALLLCNRREPAEPNAARRLRLLSAGGLVSLVLTATFAAIDWAMSLDPRWYSTIYGALVAIGAALAALALMIAIAAALDPLRPPVSRIAAETFNDLGTLMLAFLMLWAYFAFSQFLIIWSGNLPEESIWYVTRLRGGWQWVGLAVALLEFAVPFAALLSRDLKRSPRALWAVAAVVFFMQWVYLFWTIVPSFHPEGFHVSWVDFAALMATGGLWLCAFRTLVRRRMRRVNEEVVG